MAHIILALASLVTAISALIKTIKMFPPLERLFIWSLPLLTAVLVALAA